MLTTTLYLASASPRRHELLNQIGVAHQVLSAGVMGLPLYETSYLLKNITD